MRRLLTMNAVAVAAIATAFAISAWKVWTVRRERTNPDVRTIYIAHWQLETGYRDAMQSVIDEYNRMHAADGVRVEQMPVTEKIYGQWNNVHLISGDAPDIMEVGMTERMKGAENTAQYFAALGDDVVRSNPYNRPAGEAWTPPPGVSTAPGTPGAFHAHSDATYRQADGNVVGFLPDEPGPPHLSADARKQLVHDLQAGPWRDTFLEGMQGGFRSELQDYYAVPVAFCGTIRMMYNQPLVAQAKALARHDRLAVGRDVPAWLAGDDFPKTIGELFELCDALRRLPTPQGARQAREMLRERLQRSADTEWAWQTGPPKTVEQVLAMEAVLRELPERKQYSAFVTAIAGTRYSVNQVMGNYLPAMTIPLGPSLDTDHNGTVDWLETMAAYQRGDWSFEHPAMRDYFQCLKALCGQFPHGFMGMGRETSVHTFVQSQAAIRVSGAWDAYSLLKLADFPVGVAMLPLPGRDEPWGQFVRGYPSEADRLSGATFGVYKFSRNRDWAIDFLEFLSSYRWNQEFNRGTRWIPVVVGTVPAPEMIPFIPDVRGPSRGWGLNFGMPGVLHAEVENNTWLYIQGEISYEKLAANLDESFRDAKRGVDDLWRRQRQTNRDFARGVERSLTAQRMGSLLLHVPDAEDKYRRLLLHQLQAQDGEADRARFEEQEHRPFPAE